MAHVGGLALAFTAAARKDFGPLTDTPPTDGAQLDDDWRTAYPARLAELARAWQDPAAWEGMSRAGGVDFPGEVGGIVALTEVVHPRLGCRARRGQSLRRRRGHAEGGAAARGRSSPPRAPVEGLFGPAVPVADDAPALDRIIAMSGRDPGWARAPADRAHWRPWIRFSPCARLPTTKTGRVKTPAG